MTTTNGYENISPTAKLVAFWRQHSDVPYAAEVARISHAEEACQEILRGSNLVPAQLGIAAPFLEARYKSIVKAIEREGIKQVLEIASGLSLRGAVMTKDPSMVYVETDLPDMHAEKLRVMSELGLDETVLHRPNLHFQPANALDFEALESATRHFRSTDRIAIVHEGLLQYLSMSEKERVAANVKRLLEQFDGVWITPDLDTKSSMERHKNDALAKAITAATARSTGRDFLANAFDDEASMRAFFMRLGFNLEARLQIDGSFELSSLAHVDVPKDLLDSYAAELKLWLLRLKVPNELC